MPDTPTGPRHVPALDFDAFPAELITKDLLGPLPLHERASPRPWTRAREFRAYRPKEWPTDKAGREYLHRGLAHRLSELGGTSEAAKTTRRDLEDGRLRVVVIDDEFGDEHPIPQELWRAATASADAYWTGRANIVATSGPRLGRFVGDLYLAPEEPKELDLTDSEALCKLLLHLAGKQSAAQIAARSTGSKYAVPERTVSGLLKKARNLLAEKMR